MIKLMLIENTETKDILHYCYDTDVQSVVVGLLVRGLSLMNIGTDIIRTFVDEILCGVTDTKYAGINIKIFEKKIYTELN